MAADWFSQANTALLALSTVVSLAIVALAVQGYRRTQRRSMLVLAAGIGTLTFLSTVVLVLVGDHYGTGSVPVASGAMELLGIVLILVATDLARREGL